MDEDLRGASARKGGSAPDRAGAPLVTCAMVSSAAPARLDYVKASIADFLRQSYPNRELLVVLDGPDAEAQGALIRYLQSLQRPEIRVLHIPEKLTLGRLRNLSFQHARGEIVCQWDDDDRHHPDRLSVQVGALLDDDCEAVCLQAVMQYFPDRRRLFLANWAATPEQSFPGSLMAWRTAPIRYPEDGPEARLGEDSHVALHLNAQGKLRHLSETAHLYVYVSHGENSWPGDHHRRLADLWAVSRGFLHRRETVLSEGLRAFAFDAFPVTVWGNNGPAFRIEADGGWRPLSDQDAPRPPSGARPRGRR